MAIDSVKYPLLYRVSLGADWLGSGEFHDLVAAGGGGLWETWFNFVLANAGLGGYAPRLKGPQVQFTGACREIAVAHFLVTWCGMRIVEWQPHGSQGMLGEFAVASHAGHRIFVEVKSPRWQGEIAQVRGDTDPRLCMPKYTGIETRATGPWAAAKYAIKKAYPKVPDTMPTLLVINDDLLVPLAKLAAITHDIDLYVPKSRVNPDGGAFADDRYERLGGVGLLTVDDFDTRRGVQYTFALFENPHALPAVALPPEIGSGYPRYNASGRVTRDWC